MHKSAKVFFAQLSHDWEWPGILHVYFRTLSHVCNTLGKMIVNEDFSYGPLGRSWRMKRRFL